jgi:hypothetical protein
MRLCCGVLRGGSRGHDKVVVVLHELMMAVFGSCVAGGCFESNVLASVFRASDRSTCNVRIIC